MIRNSAIALCLSYIIGLLCTNLISFSGSGLSRSQLPVAFLAAVISAIATGIIKALGRGRSFQIKAIAIDLKANYRLYLSAALIAWVAIIYLQLRLPQPRSNDISYRIAASESEFVTVSAKVLTEPRLNNAQRLKFLLKVSAIGDRELVSGKLYATLPLLQGTGLHPGTRINLSGVLYLPQKANRPGGFDFKAYLARQGIFAGIQGFNADFEPEAGWGWWRLRQRIVRSQLRGLGSPIGQLVSSMVLGRKAVDLPGEIRDRFIEAGLAHVLAASGFHVSLLLGIILKLTSRLAAKPRLIVGIGTLIVYLGLTGLQASVFRACLMGTAVLIALTLETKVKPLGSLLLAATIILLFNPLFISDLGFQLSFLATFGLIVTMPSLQKRLDWLPTNIATLVAVPLAASVWVLPLLSYGFNRVAVYSVVVNIICTPLILMVSLGGMIGAIAALIVPSMGSAIAWLLYYPAVILIAIVNFFTSLPGSSWAIGQISLGTLLIIYSLYVLVWLNQWWRDRLFFSFLFAVTLIFAPIAYQHFNLTQITVLPGKSEPIVIIQDRGEVVLINSDAAKTVKYSLIPWLDRQGINQIDYAIDLPRQSDADWEQISDRLPIKNFVFNPDSLDPFFPTQKTQTQSLDKAIATKSFKISFDRQLALLKLDTAKENWLILASGNQDPNLIIKYIQAQDLELENSILVSQKIALPWLTTKPQAVIFLADRKGETDSHQNQIQFYSLQREGVVTWTIKDGIKLLEADDNW